MKTTNKIQKTALAAAVAAGLAIISFASNAQTAFKSIFEDIETNHIAMVMSKTNNSFGSTTTLTGNIIGANAYSTYLAAETEEALEVEDWMINENNFTTMAFLVAETESPLEVEDWMTNESNFDVNSFSFETETDNEMILESWMINENNFDVKQEQSQAIQSKVKSKVISTGTFIFSEINDESVLKIEDWMINPKTWSN